MRPFSQNLLYLAAKNLNVTEFQSIHFEMT